MRGAMFLLSFAISFSPWPASVSAHDHDHMMKAVGAAIRHVDL